MLGLYDSGLGGLTVLAAIRAAGIDQDIIYFADQAHVPYGERTDADLHSLLTDNLAMLGTHGVDLVAMACNTSCAVASKLGWPVTTFPVLDLIGNAARAIALTHHRRIVVLATAATVRSGAYRHAIHAVAPQIEVIEIPAPALVPLVESGAAESREAHDAVAALLAEFPADIDAVVYGCTHYPMLEAHVTALAPHLARIDPAQEQARAVVAEITALALPHGTAETTYVTNGDRIAYESNVRRWTGDISGRVVELSAAH